MITLELLTDRVFTQLPSMPRLGVELDEIKKSDRGPSLWQKDIIDRSSGTLMHIFDKEFISSDGARWLYESVSEQGWKRFWFKGPEEHDFFDLLRACLSIAGPTWLLCDAQFGPSARVYRPHTSAQFQALYRRAGIRINSAMLIRA